MNNWEEIHECEDARDAERLRKREALTKESLALTNSMAVNFDEDMVDIEGTNSVHAKTDFVVQQTLLKLHTAQWFSSPQKNNITPHEVQLQLPGMTISQMKHWNSQIKQQEQIVINNRKNHLDPNNQQDSSPTVPETENKPAQANGQKLELEKDVPNSELPSLAEGNGDKESTEDLLNRIIMEETLNEKQTIAFQIIANAFLLFLNDRKNGHNPFDDPNFKPYLRLLLSGPGGTGKTHVVRAVQRVMEAHGCRHNIRFLAPSGSAAALIDGMTVHKGLGIKVQKKKKHDGQSNGDVSEDYSVICSIMDRTKLRDEFKDVMVIMLDEVSLLGAQLLAELDHALRYVKSNNEFFGGIIVIFAGDFYQFPPVMGTPLYNPIKNYAKITQEELLKRLGRLAWKSVTDVVILEEQERMKKDPLYGRAVLNLRKRQCTQADVNLFNTRVVKSNENPNGIDMSLDQNQKATAIVSTNLLRQAINMQKAIANCKENDKLILCAALDSVKSKVIPLDTRKELLDKDVSRLSQEGALPGYLPLYEGMPIILRRKNLSTELGITNGSQGILRKICTNICPITKLTYFTGALVEFPQSKVALDLLPQKYFPLESFAWNFKTTIDFNDDNGPVPCQVHRTQAGFQPGFAVTGHAAQGQTLPIVLAWLHTGGFAAYVSASRATSRHGLTIIEPVTLSDLNKPLPYDLICENRRHEVMEHNTLVRFNFKAGDLQQVPDPEEEKGKPLKIGKVKYCDSGENISNVKRKATTYLQKKSRKRHKTADIGSASKKPELSILKEMPEKRPKRMLTAEILTTSKKPKLATARQEAHLWSLIPYGPVWSSSNWSCSYDSILTALFCMYIQLNNHNKIIWSLRNDCSAFLGRVFNELIDQNFSHSPDAITVVRDQFRDYLHSLDPDDFPRVGQQMAYTASIIQSVEYCQVLHQPMIYNIICGSCNRTTSCKIDLIMPNALSPSGWQSNARHIGVEPNAEYSTTQDWVNILFSSALRHAMPATNQIIQSTLDSHGNACSATPSSMIMFDSLPPSLILETLPGLKPKVIPDIEITLKSELFQKQYYLRGVVYSGSVHFTARLLDQQSVWNYDGAKNGGKPYLESTLNDTTWNCRRLLTFEEREMQFLIYGQE